MGEVSRYSEHDFGIKLLKGQPFGSGGAERYPEGQIKNLKVVIEMG